MALSDLTICYTVYLSTLCQQSLCQSKMPRCIHLSIQLPQNACQWVCGIQYYFQRFAVYVMVKERSASLFFRASAFFQTWQKTFGLCSFLWVVEQCFANKTFYWDGCNREWVLALAGRNQSNQAPSAHQEKTPTTYIFPEAKWDLLFLRRFREFKFDFISTASALCGFTL